MAIVLRSHDDGDLSTRIRNITSWPNPECSADHGGGSADVFYCTTCDELYCGDCWIKAQPLHKKLPHEKTIPNHAITVHTVLGVSNKRNPTLADIIDKLHVVGSDHVRDGDNQWFGVSRNEQGDCLLGEGPAYEELLLEHPGTPSGITYPSVVSFIGDTGAGKSALVNLLIKFSSSPYRNFHVTPIVGVPGGFASTSSNVHLYADPDTFDTDNPIVYADCEGMRGDDKPDGILKREATTDDEQTNTDSRHRLVPYNPRKIE